MKKIYTYILLLAGAMIFASCQKDFVSLLVEMEEYQSGNEKVYISDDLYACWNNGDSVMVNDVMRFVSISGSKASIVIEGEDDPSETHTYTAAYPGELVTNSINANVKVNVPQLQDYVEVGQGEVGQGRQMIQGIMAGYTDNTTLKFRNAGALMYVKLKNSENSDIVIKNIKLKSTNSKTLSGLANINLADRDNPVLNWETSPTNSNFVMLATDNYALANTKTKPFFIAIPTLSTCKLEVEVRYSKGAKMYRYTRAIGGDGITIGRNQILSLSVNLGDEPYTFEVNFEEQGTETDPIQIENLNDLDLLALQSTANDFDGKFFKQTADITMPKDFPGVGTSTTPFRGNYDGNSRKISYPKNSETMGLFNYVGGSISDPTTYKTTISNLTIKNQMKSQSGTFGGIIDVINGSHIVIENCKTDNGVANISGSSVCGGICGEIKSGSGDINMNNCANNMEIRVTGNGGAVIGGIVGQTEETTNEMDIEGLNFLECQNKKLLQGATWAGGIIGIGQNINLTKCVNHGALMSIINGGGLIGKGVAKGSFEDPDNGPTPYETSILSSYTDCKMENCTQIGGIAHTIIGGFSFSDGYVENDGQAVGNYGFIIYNATNAIGEYGSPSLTDVYASANQNEYNLFKHTWTITVENPKPEILFYEDHAGLSEVLSTAFGLNGAKVMLKYEYEAR